MDMASSNKREEAVFLPEYPQDNFLSKSPQSLDSQNDMTPSKKRKLEAVYPSEHSPGYSVNPSKKRKLESDYHPEYSEENDAPFFRETFYSQHDTAPSKKRKRETECLLEYSHDVSVSNSQNTFGNQESTPPSKKYKATNEEEPNCLPKHSQDNSTPHVRKTFDNGFYLPMDVRNLIYQYWFENEAIEFAPNNDMTWKLKGRTIWWFDDGWKVRQDRLERLSSNHAKEDSDSEFEDEETETLAGSTNGSSESPQGGGATGNTHAGGSQTREETEDFIYRTKYRRTKPPKRRGNDDKTDTAGSVKPEESSKPATGFPTWLHFLEKVPENDETTKLLSLGGKLERDITEWVKRFHPVIAHLPSSLNVPYRKTRSNGNVSFGGAYSALREFQKIQLNLSMSNYWKEEKEYLRNEATFLSKEMAQGTKNIQELRLLFHSPAYWDTPADFQAFLKNFDAFKSRPARHVLITTASRERLMVWHDGRQDQEDALDFSEGERKRVQVKDYRKDSTTSSLVPPRNLDRARRGIKRFVEKVEAK